MAELVDPYLEIKWGYAIGEDGWGDGVNENLLKLGFFANKRIDGEVAELPLIAQEGEAYFLQPDQRVYFYANATWYSSPVPKGTIFTRKSDEVRFQYTGEPTLERVLEVSKEDIDGLDIDAATVNGHTVESSVPPNAKFTDTTYTIKDGELSEINFTSARRDKLAGIEAGAEVNNISDANANALVNGQSNTLHYHASDRNRANHTGTQAISTIVNLQTELDDRVKQDDARLSDAREWTATVVSQAEAEAGSSSTARKWTAQRVRQAIVAWWTGFSSAIGKALATAPDAASARSTISAVADNDSRLTDSREWTATTVSQAEAEAGTATTRRAWTAQRVRQAVAAWWSGFSSAIGKAIATAPDAATARGAINAVADDDARLSNAREWTASVVTQAEAEAGTSTTSRKWTSQRVRQAIVAWWNGYSSSIGRQLATAQSSEEARAAIGAVTGGDVTDQLGQMAFLDKATKAQAEEGVSDLVGMTPARTRDAYTQWGLGVVNPPTYAMDSAWGNRVFRVDGEDPSNPVDRALVGINLNITGHDWGGQILLDHNLSSGALRYRPKSGGVFGPIRMVWDTLNLPQSSIDNWNTAYSWGDYRQFGIGVPDGQSPAEVADVDAAKTSGNFRLPGNASGDHPFPGVSCSLRVEKASSSFITQWATRGGSDSSFSNTRAKIRRFNGTEWLPWAEVCTSANLPNIQSATPANGGLLVDNQKTGTGLERVLTESDLSSAVGDVTAAGDNTFTGTNTFTKRIKFNQFGGMEIGPGGNGTSVISNDYSGLEISHESPSANISLAVRYDGTAYYPLVATKDGVTLSGEDGYPSAMSTSPSNGGLLVYNGVTGDAFTAERVATTSDLNLKANASTTISAGPGLTGGGNLSANRTLSVNFGTTAGTVAQGNDSRIINGQTAYSWGDFRDFGLGTGGLNLSELTAYTPNGFYRILGGVSGAPFPGALIVATFDGTPTKRALLIGNSGELATAYIFGDNAPVWTEQAPKPSRVSVPSSRGMSKNDDGMILFTANGMGSYTVNQNIRPGATIGICTSLTNTNLTITPGSGFSLVWQKGGSYETGSRTIAPKSTVTLIQQNSDTWLITGNGIS